MAGLLTRERIILAIDTSQKTEAEHWVQIAKNAGARFIKFGLEFSCATSWEYCSGLAAEYGLEWVADAKLDDIPKTVAGAVRNLCALPHPPFAITIHTTAGQASLQAAQQEAGDVKLLGVTILTSIPEPEALDLYGVQSGSVSDKVLSLAKHAVQAGLSGVVCSPAEVGFIKNNPGTKHLFAMIPGARSATDDAQDQSRVGTPAAAIKGGADLVVIGRQITRDADPATAYEAVVHEIEEVTI